MVARRVDGLKERVSAAARDHDAVVLVHQLLIVLVAAALEDPELGPLVHHGAQFGVVVRVDVVLLPRASGLTT